MEINTELALFLVAISSILAALLSFIWVAVRLGPKGRRNGANHTNNGELFDDNFRNELRERGITRFERTLDQNATFLQQDLHSIGEEVTEFIKERAGDILKEEFSEQKKAIATAQQHLAQTFLQVDTAIKQQQKEISAQYLKELQAEKERRLQDFSANMAEIVTKHVEQTLSTHMDIGQQMKYILANLEANKQAIVEDIKREI